MADDWAWDDHIPSGVHGMDGYDSVSCSCGWDSETGKLGWVEHIRAMGADSLDAAWAEAEVALPEGWHLFLSSSPDAGHDAYARKPGSILPWDFTGNGPTPAAALRALAARLQERAG